VIDHETSPESDSDPERRGASKPRNDGDGFRFALVVAWSRDEPWRIGQSLLVPPGNPGPWITFGRGPIEVHDPRKVLLQEHRYDRSDLVPPLSTSSISRSQLEIRAFDTHYLLVRNVGQCALLRNGMPTSESEFQAGDTLQLGKQLLLIVTTRPSSWSSGCADYPNFPFGEADAHGIVGESAAAWTLRGAIAIVAQRAGHVLISGPSGSGKELAAQAVHALSKVGHRPLVARSAATIPDTLFDAELFGNCKNYPNPGMLDRPGLIGEANGSSLFLDEIGELPQGSQAHLLRVLDNGEYHRLGDATARRAQIRLIAATNRDLDALKHDLLARLTLRIAVPSLTERVEDIPLLVRHLLRRAAAKGDALARSILDVQGAPSQAVLGLDFTRMLLERRFELGVRELESVLWRNVTAPDLQTRAKPGGEPSNAPPVPPPAEAPPEPATFDPEQPITASQIQRCLDENNGVVELAWRALGMKNRYELVRAIKKYDIEVRRRPARGALRRVF
jgi:two-component system nitrogen regulation response regulator GlnG/two-component system response regulator HydG